MTTFAEAEAARLRAVEILRAAGLSKHADCLAALPPITNRQTAYDAARAACHAAYDAASAAYYAAYDAYDAAYVAAAGAAYVAAERDAGLRQCACQCGCPNRVSISARCVICTERHAPLEKEREDGA